MHRLFRSALALLALVSAGVGAQQVLTYDSPAQIEAALAQAKAQGEAARIRAEQLEARAAEAGEVADRTAQEAAGLAARIQQAEAKIAGHEARIGLIEHRRRALRERLAAKQLPLVGLTASLQRLSRIPPTLALLRPGTLDDAARQRAVLSTVLPIVERRTAAVRGEIRQARALQNQSRLAVADLRRDQQELRARRSGLAALETRQRLDSRVVSGVADREAERALALAEQARDLDSLADEVGKSGELRTALAALPGPVMRPARPDLAQVVASGPPPAPPTDRIAYILPLTGRLVSGFGEASPGHARSRGISLAVRQGAQAVAPAAGRIAFAGPYRGYGSIVIIEHAGGWTSLITGLAQLDARVGERIVAGSPLGIAGAGRPVLTLELRKNGQPVNPLEHIKAL